MGSFLSHKNTVLLQIRIEKNNLTISDDFGLSEEFSTFFEDAVRSLNAKPDEWILPKKTRASGVSDPRWWSLGWGIDADSRLV